MPVQFTCSHCRRTLSVARRKAGTSVACPKCGQSTVVPVSEGPPSDVHPLPILGDSKGPADTASSGTMHLSASTIPAAKASSPAISAPAVVPPLANEIGAFDDIPALIGEAETVAAATGTAGPALPAAPPPPPPPLPTEAVSEFQFTESIPSATTRLAQTRSAASRFTQIRRGRQTDGKVLLVTRQAVYAQAGLMAGLLIVAFLAGLLVGRGSRDDKSAPMPEKVVAEPVALSGHVLYALSPGDSLPDEGAVVIALPSDRKPDVKIAAHGLRADDATDLDAEAALSEIGAAMARSDARGQFQLVVPRPGNYAVLMISSHATRPDGVTLPMADGEELSRYFASPNQLIGQKRYALISQRLTGAPAPLTHEFGPTDKR
jgi:DNA-directed RNA polymerase subunit RPC12/RpoP